MQRPSVLGGACAQTAAMSLKKERKESRLARLKSCQRFAPNPHSSERSFLASSRVNSGERETLETFLAKIAQEQKLRPGIHPGYRRLGESEER
jgi:hypothetical protein